MSISEGKTEEKENTMEENGKKNTRKMCDSFTIESLVGNAILKGGTIEEVTEFDSEGIRPLHFAIEIPDLEGNNHYMDVDVTNEIVQTWYRFLEDTLSYRTRWLLSEITVYDFNDRIIYENEDY